MIGAIKRRWKSKKAKVLHKGAELSTSSDTCPSSRGFALDTCTTEEEIEKIMGKPPSPRQVHPVLEKGDHHQLLVVGPNPNSSQIQVQMKYTQLPPLPPQIVNQQQTQNSSVVNNSLVKKSARKGKSSTLPPCPSLLTNNTEDVAIGIQMRHLNTAPAPASFIHVNSGRIEFVSNVNANANSNYNQLSNQRNNNNNKGLSLNSNCKASSTNKVSVAGSGGGDCTTQDKFIWRNRARLYNKQNLNNVDTTRHSWCGSVFRGGIDVQQPRKGMVSLVEENNLVVVAPVQAQTVSTPNTAGGSVNNYNQNNNRNNIIEEEGSLSAQLLNPLKERLAAIEDLTRGLQSKANVANASTASNRDEEKEEYERCVSELAGQVSRAVALQQQMRTEVEKLQMRVVHLENHNKAMTTMIIPTLMKLHETVVVKENSLSSSEAKATASTTESTFSPNVHKNLKYETKNTPMTKKKIQVQTDPNTCPKSIQSDKEPSTTTNSTTTTAFTSTTINSKKSQEESQTPLLKKPKGECRIPRMSNGNGNARLNPNPLANSPKRISYSRNSPTNISKHNNSCPSSSEENQSQTAPTPPPNAESISNNHNHNSPINNNPNTITSLRNSPNQIKTKTKAIPRPISYKSRKLANQSPSTSTSPIPNSNSNSQSKLPVRKTQASITKTTAPSTKHPAATTKSLPLQQTQITSNETPTYNSNTFTKSAVSSKSSRSTFGYSPNTSPGVKSSITTGGKVLQKLIGGNTTVSLSGKDEGYSTMSSEALAIAEQEAVVVLQQLKKSISPIRDTEEIVTLSNKTPVHKSNTFNTFTELSSTETPTGCNSTSNKIPKPPRNNNSSYMKNIQNLRNFSSLPKQSKVSIATASVHQPTSITTFRENVRIVGGTPYEIRYSEPKTEDDDETSTSTVLWEDSDDSDILFLPVEISSSEELGSQSTLVPNSRCSYTSWTSNTSQTSTSHNSNSISRSSAGPTPTDFSLSSASGKNSQNSAAWSNCATGHNQIIEVIPGENSSFEEKSLIDKWMRLEDVRNEVTWDEEWAWDWDGVLHPRAQVQIQGTGHLTTVQGQKSEVILEEDNSDDEEGFWFASSKEKPLKSPQVVGNSFICDKTSGAGSSTFPSSQTEVLEERKSVKETPEGCQTPTQTQNQIDSSTWTKSKKLKPNPNPTANKMRKLLPKVRDEEGIFSPFLNSPREFPEEESTSSNSNSNGNFNCENDISSSSSMIINYTNETLEDDRETKICHEHKIPVIVTTGADGTEIEHVETNEGSITPPQIEFTREFYRLANYGSNLSFQENDISNISNNGGKLAVVLDDKISQTDFTSSLDNLSVSSELFSECNNCIEIIKKLVAHTTNSGELSESDGNYSSNSNSISNKGRSSSPGGGRGGSLFMMSQFERKLAEMATHSGSSTAWLSVPHGVPSAEVENRFLEMLSSSESEDVLSPAK